MHLYSWHVIPRHLAATLRRTARGFPVLSVTGPRQSGKTTLLRSLFPNLRYVSLERPDERRFATEDPRGFLRHHSAGVILDEVQHVPDLFSYVQVAVDEDSTPGRFILSGSQNFLRMARISQSLAGRVFVSNLLPFSLAELARRQSATVAGLLAGPAATAGTTETAAALDGPWLAHAVRGFYPPIHDRNLAPQDWFPGYFQTYLQRDVRDLTQVGDLESFSRFVMLCAGRAGQILNLSNLGNDCGISHDTARRWLSVLETSFVVFPLQPHHRNFNKRLIKSPKLYFVDTGLLCWLLQVRDEDQLARHPLRGAVFENMMIAEALKISYHSGELPRLHFWRDHRGNEVDLVVDTPDGGHPVEIKSGETIRTDQFKGLAYWGSLSGQRTPATLIYGGEESSIRNGVDVRAWRHWL